MVLTLSEGKKIFNIIKKRLPFPSYVVGSIRREEPLIKDIDIIIIPGCRDITDIMLSILDKIKKFGDQIINGIYYYKNKPILIDFFITIRKELPYSMLQWTGPATYNIRIRKYVKDKYGWLLNQHGLFYRNCNSNYSRRVANTSNIKTEKEINDFIGTTYYKPCDRQ